jgi:hypothetical protein
MITAVFQQSRQAVAATYGDFVLGGALWPQSLDFWGENLRPDLYWLYVAMADLSLSPLMKVLSGVQSDFLHGENP